MIFECAGGWSGARKWFFSYFCVSAQNAPHGSDTYFYISQIPIDNEEIFTICSGGGSRYGIYGIYYGHY